MLALTVRHPWPFAICRMGKNLENRTWRPRAWGREFQVGDWFAIHGGRVPTVGRERDRAISEFRELFSRFGVPLGWEDVRFSDLCERHSGIVAVVRYGGIVTESTSPWFEGPLGWVLDEVHVLDRPIPCSGRAEMRRAWGVPVNARVVGYYGRISDEKDPYALERAVAALPYDWYGVAVGSSLWGQRGPSGDRVRWVGPDDRSGDVLSALDVHLVASHYESFGLSLAEGLWLGVPTVSTEVGIAKLVPYLTELVATDSPGPELARAVLDAQRNATRRAERSQVWARAVLDPRVFGQLWTKLLVREARQAAVGPVPRVWWGTPDQGKALKARVNRCSHRTPHGGCACDGWCDLNRGATVTDPATETRRSLVTLDDCLRCDLVPRT